MKIVKDLKKWIDSYQEAKMLVEEVQLSFDYCKENIVTDIEVDQAYSKALAAIENLELRNMLRDEADSMSCVVKINSGAGGTESQDWASMLMRMYSRYAERHNYKTKFNNILDGDMDIAVRDCQWLLCLKFAKMELMSSIRQWNLCRGGKFIRTLSPFRLC